MAKSEKLVAAAPATTFEVLAKPRNQDTASWDYISQFGTDDEVYALTAYILSRNELIGDNDVMDAKTLPQVKMPNRDNFIMPYPDRL